MSERRKEMDITNNSTVYNRYRKAHLEAKGEIYCSYCRYHRGENRGRGNWYGGFIEEGETFKEAKISYPSWKLASKNPKQWVPKNYVRMTIEDAKAWARRNYEFVDFQIGDGRVKGIKYYKR
jgi:hypothetical protein